MFATIDHKKQLLDSKRPWPTYTLKSLREKILLEWTYHSNAIEGNTLTLNETKVVLEGITVGGKTMMENLIKWYEHQATALHAVERAASLHIIFVGIHPFLDGNGRTARLLLNLELMKAGFPPIVIKVEHRLAYYIFEDKS